MFFRLSMSAMRGISSHAFNEFFFFISGSAAVGVSPLECTTLDLAVGISYLNRAVQPLELLGVTGSRHHFATLPTYVAPSCAIVQTAVSVRPP